MSPLFPNTAIDDTLAGKVCDMEIYAVRVLAGNTSVLWAVDALIRPLTRFIIVVEIVLLSNVP